MARRIVGIHEKLPILETLPLSFQHLTAMFGATILVPILLGVDPAIALLMNGIGTLIYTWVTKGGHYNTIVWSNCSARFTNFNRAKGRFQ